ncbi:GPW/gp25 family protein [Dysgonomonas sp. ZJ279]|uniref:GPW/gp25 family protein n=1 Tax=Dysgonomonas sp. ZJ279 TaxID=2709796 RepID=UPI0013EC39E5|nr:GPW/gp25 family protein [Dysgonomonas sp. ZJ279]
MKKTCYKLPIRFDSIIDGASSEMSMCTEQESIDQHIGLLLTTCPGEHRFNKSFGCGIWDMDFERVVSRKKWEEDFTGHILSAVKNFEQRLKDISVSIHITEVTREDMVMKTTAIKKKVTVLLKAKLVSTNEDCGFKYNLFLGPLSTE